MSAYGPLMISIASLQLNTHEKNLLKDPRVGGVILFQHNYKDTSQLLQLTDSIKAIDEKIIIAVDHEGGRVQRFCGEGFTQLPAARLLGSYYDDEPERAYHLAFLLGACSSQELGRFHIDCVFAPVLDIDTDLSEVIGDRAYHQNPEVVTVLAASYLQGLHSGGLCGVGKHFPGHGHVREDTHYAMAIDRRELDAIYRTDLYPYQYLIQENLLDAIMMAHVIYPGLDTAPASQSERWMTTVLRQDLDFQGVLFSDDLSMKGFSEHPGSADSVLRAGCNMLIVCHSQKLIKRCLKSLAASKQLDDYREILCKKWENRKQELIRMQERTPKPDLSDLPQELATLMAHYGS